MRVLIYSDVHGNLPAFEKMLKDVGHCDQYICLGDLVNYGPWSNECVDLALSLPNSVNIIGNHETAYIDRYYPGPNPLVQLFFAFTLKGFDRFEEIKKFIPSYRLGIYRCQHTIEDAYIYPDTTVSLDDNYVIGHSHHQFKYTQNGFVLYNAGSVGQNRKILRNGNYLIYDADSGQVEMKTSEYSVETLISEMKRRNYPEECMAYYFSKINK